MLALLIFILILSTLVFVHELGHFALAKKNGVRVEEFGLGLPPKLFSKKVGETEYSLNWLPFGGFVRLLGEDSVEISKDNRNFTAKTPFQRFSILVAGVVMNLLLAITLYYVFFLFNGFTSLNIPLMVDYKFPFGNVKTVNTLVISHMPESAGKEAGIIAGEAITEVNGIPVSTVPEIRALIADKAGNDVTLTLVDKRKQNHETTRTVTVIPKFNSVENQAVLGVYMGKVANIEYLTPVDKLLAGPFHAVNVFSYSMNVFGTLIGSSIANRSIQPVSEGMSGPVGIYSVVGGILEFSGEAVFWTLIDFVALMSLSLAFMNILPLPALDGGRIVFVVLEFIRGKKINPEVEANVHKWGMVVLLGLILLVTIRDVGRIFS